MMQHATSTCARLSVLLALTVGASLWPAGACGEPVARPLSVLGHIGGAARAVDLQGTTAFAGIGPDLVALDLSDPSDPVELARLPLPSIVEKIVRLGDTIVLRLRDDSVRLIDAGDPASLQMLSSISGIGPVVDIAITTPLLCIADNQYTLRAFDISDPSHPVAAAEFSPLSTPKSLAAQGGYAYVGNAYTVQIVDLRDLGDPKLAGYVNFPGSPLALAAANNVLNIMTQYEALSYNVSNPAGGLRTLLINLEGAVGYTAMQSVGKFFYVTDEAAGLRIVELVPPHDAPTLRADFPLPAYPRDVSVSGSLACVADDSAGVRAIGVGNPAAPVSLGAFDRLNEFLGMDAVDDRVLIAGGNDGLEIVSIADPTSPSLVGALALPGRSLDVAASGTFACVASGSAHMQIVDVSIPSSPLLRGSLSLPKPAVRVVAAGRRVYLACQDAGLRIADISDPDYPVELGGLDFPGGSVVDLAVDGDRLYAACSQGGLRIVDVANPASPTVLGQLPGQGAINRVAASGGRVCIVDDARGLAMVNATDPAAPAAGDFMSLDRLVSRLALKSDYAYLADAEGGVSIVALRSGVAPPYLRWAFQLPGSAASVALSGNSLVASDETGGLYILRDPVDLSAAGLWLDYR